MLIDPDGIADNGDEVLIGDVPFATLGMSFDQLIDPYLNKLTYAVSRSVSYSDPGTGGTGLPVAFGSGAGGALDGASPPGSIIINDSIGTTLTNQARFALVYHGLNGRGARNKFGNISANCSNEADAVEGENCDFTISGAEDNIYVENSAPTIILTAPDITMT